MTSEGVYYSDWSNSVAVPNSWREATLDTVRNEQDHIELRITRPTAARNTFTIELPTGVAESLYKELKELFDPDED